MSWMVNQLIQLAGSALILIAFVGAQTGRLDQKARPYLLANALGAAALAIDAAYFRQWGFLLLEGSWAIVSVMGILSAALSARKNPDRPGLAAGHVPGDGVPSDHSCPAGMRASTGDLPGSATTDSGDRRQIVVESSVVESLPTGERRIEAGARDAVFI